MKDTKVFRFSEEDLKMLHSLLVDKTNDWEKTVKTTSKEVYKYLKAIQVEPDEIGEIEITYPIRDIITCGTPKHREFDKKETIYYYTK